MRSPHAVIQTEDAERFRAFVARWLGFELDDEKLWSLTDILRRRVREKGCSAQSYLAGLESAHPFSDELRTLAHELTINETSFFRNTDQMTAFAEVALPERLAAQSGGRKLRILSAGCASGEEAYSLAMIIHNLQQAADYDIGITGIDADTNVLKKAIAARYSPWSLRQTPPSYRSDFFRSEKHEFVLSGAIRSRVTFEERNLVLDDPSFWAPGSFDIVFCRNVIMYFTQDVARAVIARIAGSLVPGGFLFLGVAETLRDLSDDFDLRHTHNTFYYQRRDGLEKQNTPAADTVPGADFVEAIGGATRRIQSLSTSSNDVSSVSINGTKKKPVDLDPIIELFRCERASEALALLNELPASVREDSHVLLLTAILLTQGNDLAEAERVCAELLLRDPRNPGAHYLMALCKESAGDHAGAVKCDRAATVGVHRRGRSACRGKHHRCRRGRLAGDDFRSRRADANGTAKFWSCRAGAAFVRAAGGRYFRHARCPAIPQCSPVAVGRTARHAQGCDRARRPASCRTQPRAGSHR
jgi:chemotaxis protein methyltransferase CheR